MSVYTQLKIGEFGRSCRRCINDAAGVSLKTEDCVYLPYPAVCSHCEQLKNIVIEVREVKRLLLKFRRNVRSKKIATEKK